MERCPRRSRRDYLQGTASPLLFLLTADPDLAAAAVQGSLGGRKSISSPL